VRSLKTEVLTEEDTFAIVAEIESTDEIWTGKPEIVGYATWVRDDKEDEKKKSWAKSEIGC